jgi:flagellar basal-body rod modification protein FlgD
MYASPIINDASSPAAQSSSSSSTSSSSGTGIDSMFMQLLITQLQNQDPLSPMDPSTFVTQLVGVNTLDQVSQINQLLQTKTS